MTYAPLGPAWAAPLDLTLACELLRRDPSLLPALGESARAVRGMRLYALTDTAQAQLRSRGAVFELASSVCVLGAFDGVHAGHRELVRLAAADARARRLPCVGVTFDPDPADVLVGATRGMRLLMVGERLQELAALGLDAVLVVPFTRELARVGYAEFLRSWLFAATGAAAVHVGADFRMGSGGAGTVEALAAEGARLGVAVFGHELVSDAGGAVSATRIRGLVHNGHVAEAARLLGRYHGVRGEVAHGRGEGTSFGFPTANVHVDAASCLPSEGVYAAFALAGRRAFPAAVNVGAPRSFGGAAGVPMLEATLLGFEGNLYGEQLSVCFVEWLREPRTFASLAELEQTVLGNVSWVGHYVGTREVEL